MQSVQGKNPSRAVARLHDSQPIGEESAKPDDVDREEVRSDDTQESRRVMGGTSRRPYVGRRQRWFWADRDEVGLVVRWRGRPGRCGRPRNAAIHRIIVITSFIVVVRIIVTGAFGGQLVVTGTVTWPSLWSRRPNLFCELKIKLRVSEYSKEFDLKNSSWLSKDVWNFFVL